MYTKIGEGLVTRWEPPTKPMNCLTCRHMSTVLHCIYSGQAIEPCKSCETIIWKYDPETGEQITESTSTLSLLTDISNGL